MQNKLEKSWTAYKKYGKGVKHQLKFSKSGIKSIEDAYATHYLTRKSPETTKQLNE
jgi:ribosomal protein L35